jgi:catechol 2,3-dioxygenase-like lactoylglutathione lyase family enzyme
MFDHVTIRVADRNAAERFYDTVLAALGVDETYRTAAFSEWQDFLLTGADDELPPTRGLHVAFAASSRERVDEFWRVGTAAGYADDGRPGPGPEYGSDGYAGFLLDPDGNSAAAVHHDARRRGGLVEHVRIRVADVAAAKRFYETIAPYAGLRVAHDAPDRVAFTQQAGGSLALLGGTPTRDLHLAFPTDDDGDVQRFHEAATEAGYRSNGPPGERPRYHPGYYAAYVLDPDGNNIEVVNHHRSG